MGDWEDSRSEFFQETYPTSSDRSICESTANASIRSSIRQQPNIGQYRDVSVGTLESRSSHLSRQSAQAGPAKNPTASTTPADAVSPSGDTEQGAPSPPQTSTRNAKARMKAAVQGLEEDDDSEGEIEVVDFTDENLATEVESWHNQQKLRDMPISLSEKRNLRSQYEKCPKIKLTKAMSMKFACLRLAHGLGSLRMSICNTLQNWSKPLICIDRHRGSEQFVSLGLQKVTIFILFLVALTQLSFLLLPYLVFICDLSFTKCQSSKNLSTTANDHDQFWLKQLRDQHQAFPFYYSFLSPKPTASSDSDDFILFSLFNDYFPLVYLLVMTACHLGIALYFFRGLVRLIRRVTADETSDTWFKSIFSSWNHNMVCKTSSILKHKSIYKQIKHKIYLSRSANKAQTFCTRCLLGKLMLEMIKTMRFSYKIFVFVSVGARLLSILLTVGLWGGIVSSMHFVTLMQTKSYKELDLFKSENLEDFVERILDVLVYISPVLLIVVIKILILPLALLLDKWEYFPFNTRVIAYSLRLFFSRLASLFTLVTTIFHMETNEKLDEICWEDHLCHQLIAVAVADFVADIILIVGLRFPRVLLASLFKRQWSCSTKLNYDPYECVVDLVMDLSLVCLGMIYCPVLPIVVCIKLYLGYGLRLFHIWVNCSASRETHSSSSIGLLFVGFSSVMVLFSSLIYLYAVLYNPVSTCGPFQAMGQMSQAFSSLWQHQSSNVLSTSSDVNFGQKYQMIYILASFIAVLFFGLYISHLKRLSIEKSNNELKMQLQLATQEKNYLISKIKRPTPHQQQQQHRS